MQQSKRPIIFLSVFKSGTEMMKRVIQDLTGLAPLEPEIIRGKVNYQDPAQLYFREGCFYAWHLFPILEVQRKLVEAQARPVFLLRNVYDLVVSMYYHFAHNIDADIGRGRDVDHYFREMSKAEGLSRIISGMVKADFVWKGIGPHCRQMELMLQFAERYPCFVTSYERMTQGKSAEVKRLADFLEMSLDDRQVQDICFKSRFDVMKAAADPRTVGASHFRKGRAGAHSEELNTEHVKNIQDVMSKEAPALSDLLARAGLSQVLHLNATAELT